MEKLDAQVAERIMQANGGAWPVTVEQFERCAEALGARVVWQADVLAGRMGKTLTLRRTASTSGTLARAVHELAECLAGPVGGALAHACAERVERHYRAVLAHLPAALTEPPCASKPVAPAIALKCDAPDTFQDE